MPLALASEPDHDNNANRKQAAAVLEKLFAENQIIPAWPIT